MGNKLNSFKKYIIGFLIGISFISGVSYASTGTIGGLFEKIGGSWKLVGTNIKDNSIGANQLGTNSVTTTKIVDKNVTEAKLSDAVVTKLNSPIVTETDPLSVKLTGNQTIGGTKTFTSPVFGVTPTLNAHLATKQYIDNAIAAAFPPMFTCGDTITVGGFTYTTKIAADGKCWTSTNMKHGNMLINGSTMPSNSDIIEKWCYNNNISNCDTYGALYTWSEAKGLPASCNTSNCTQEEDITKSVCGALGAGWKLPTDEDWTTLTSAGATGWTGNKLSGLISNLSGIRNTASSFTAINNNGHNWSSNWSDNNNARYRYLYLTNNIVYNTVASKTSGFSVLCINPTITGTPSYTYSWNTGTWGACSVSCGGGTQTRSVTCRRDDGVTVADSLCTSEKPTTSQTCNTGSCAPPPLVCSCNFSATPSFSYEYNVILPADCSTSGSTTTCLCNKNVEKSGCIEKYYTLGGQETSSTCRYSTITTKSYPQICY